MNNRFFRYIGLGVLALTISLLSACLPSFDKSLSPLTIVTSTKEHHTFYVEIPFSQEGRIKGLMHRESLDPQSGMLFWLGSEKPVSFWMKNTLIPLDMIFIAKDGTITRIHENAQPLDETPIPSHGAVMAVLEINGGQASDMGIKPGDKVFHRLFGNADAKGQILTP
ncbi:MAG: DUF192 domain-containing protein [Alphaproteobacteria bacterium]|nr:DUF192 domain-containing protein [Alphaproteobacteria bacterium]